MSVLTQNFMIDYVTFKILATPFHAFKGMLQCALLNRIMLLNVVSTSMHTVINIGI
jgi:hypothetical protein